MTKYKLIITANCQNTLIYYHYHTIDIHKRERNVGSGINNINMCFLSDATHTKYSSVHLNGPLYGRL